jgi:hypothetical protein
VFPAAPFVQPRPAMLIPLNWVTGRPTTMGRRAGSASLVHPGFSLALHQLPTFVSPLMVSAAHWRTPGRELFSATWLCQRRFLRSSHMDSRGIRRTPGLTHLASFLHRHELPFAELPDQETLFIRPQAHDTGARKTGLHLWKQGPNPGFGTAIEPLRALKDTS